MPNLTNTQSNNTQVPAQTIISMEARMLLIFTPVMISFVCFLYIIVVMLNVYFSSPHVRENARYILFAHMLINDTLYLTIAVSLYLFSLFQVSFPVLVCYFILIMSSSAFKVTPYNLAAMSIERYVAICFPLRHAEFCTRQRTGNVIALIWTIGLTPHVADLIILASSVKASFFSQYVSCSRVSFLNSEIQSILRSFMHAFSFSLVGLVIVFTYVKILLVAKKIGSGKDSASKASRTVMLHAFQLLLCLTAFTYPITETYLKGYIIMLPVLNFCLFMCLPRFLSPLIYGIRDDAFRVCLRRYVFCRSVNIHVDKFTH